ncbi:hypothetical protein BWI17_00640 [Betaproteobacteria bacterium GR16-43]|nr:hypothetical protein BWI17_00640 [Betaproteobacteria bacterium GR16-43]
MDPRDRLKAGQAAAQEGRFAEALGEYVWFHEHALEHEPALYGVRLSFALGYWIDLAQSFPEARRKLEEIRGNKAAVLALGQGDRHLFHDVASIDQSLGAEVDTYRLFKTLLAVAPLNAAAWFDLALEAIVHARDYALAERYSDPPDEALLRYSSSLNRDIAELDCERKWRARRIDAYAHIYVERVASIMTILSGLRKFDEAGMCLEWAETLVESRAVRKLVSEKLAKRYDA